MMQVLAPLLALGGPAPAPAPPTPLEGQLAAWSGARDGPTAPGHVALAAVRTWTRFHGAVSLELQGYFADMGFDPALLFAAEVESVLASLTRE